MADAALAKDLAVQWCYATPTDVLAALEMPAVTNFRVSNDFCYGNSWDVGISSLIVWAGGAFPSKDTLWTSDNKRYAVPGCNWTPDHEEPAAELHVVVALMSTGPVGISDGYGMTNVELAKRMISKDGTILKPSKPLTTVDSSIAKQSSSGGGGSTSSSSSSSATTNFAQAPQGEAQVYSTYSGASLDEVSAHYFVSFKMKTAWGLRSGDFYPPVPAGAAGVHRRFDAGAGCADGALAAGSGCVTVGTGFSLGGGGPCLLLSVCSASAPFRVLFVYFRPLLCVHFRPLFFVHFRPILLSTSTFFFPLPSLLSSVWSNNKTTAPLANVRASSRRSAPVGTPSSCPPQTSQTPPAARTWPPLSPRSGPCVLPARVPCCSAS